MSTVHGVSTIHNVSTVHGVSTTVHDMGVMGLMCQLFMVWVSWIWCAISRPELSRRPKPSSTKISSTEIGYKKNPFRFPASVPLLAGRYRLLNGHLETRIVKFML